jgi:hypothetical protein
VLLLKEEAMPDKNIYRKDIWWLHWGTATVVCMITVGCHKSAADVRREYYAWY